MQKIFDVLTLFEIKKAPDNSFDAQFSIMRHLAFTLMHFFYITELTLTC